MQALGTKIIALITQSGEKLVNADSGAELSSYYSGVADKPEEFPVIVGVFNNLQDYLNWKKGHIVKCQITMLYHYSGEVGIELFAEASDLSYQGAREFAKVS